MNFEEVDRYYTKLVNRQQKEIETIKERTITLNLSDADCDRLARKCGKSGLTIGKLLENFVGDLVDGTYSNGSDERDYADQWFERCWFGMFPEPTLLNHLLNLGYEPEHYLDMLENVETIKSDIEITKQNIAEPSDEWKDIVYHKYNDDRTSYECVPCYNSVDEYIASEKEDLESYKADLEEALEELKDMRADWKPEKEPNMDEELELIKKWVKEREELTNSLKGTVAKLTGTAIQDDETFKMKGGFVPERDQYYFQMQQGGDNFLVGFKDMLTCLRLLEKMKEIPQIGDKWWQQMATLYGEDILMIDFEETE